MKFLLVVPRFVRNAGDPYMFPLGLAYIAAALKQEAHDVYCLNLNHDYRPISDIIAEAVDDFDPDVCGTGTLSTLFQHAKDVFDAARATKPDIINIAGGGMVSSSPSIAGQVLDFDYGVIGEGEDSIVELADSLSCGSDPSRVTGLAIREGDGGIRLTMPRDPIRDLDALPWPDYDAFGIDQWFALEREQKMTMISSRSCPFSCSFCFHPSGRTYRSRSLDGFFAEFDQLYRKYDVKTLQLNDELFSVRKDRILEFCDRIRPYDVEWQVSLHVKSVDAETLAAMKTSGCIEIGYGVESANEAVLQSMRKKATRAEIDRTLWMTHENRIGIQANLIFGDPVETVETANDSLDWWAQNRELQINLILLKVYPGSRIFDEAVAQGRITDGAAQLLNPGRNFSKIDDVTHNALATRLMAFNETLLMPAKVLGFERGPTAHPLHGTMYDFDWLCPRCNTINEVRQFPINDPWLFQNIRVPCIECRSRFDIQNLARPPWIEPEAEALYEKAVALRDAGQIADAVDIYKGVLATPGTSINYNRPDAVAKAAYDLGVLILDHGGNPKAAVSPLTGAVLLRAYDPMRHFALGRALLAEGSPGAAKLHFQQVLRLLSVADAADIATIAAVKQLIASIPEIDPLSGYFNRLSVEAPLVQVANA
jgi:radical SAM superfamily enzyme YgiQ (UPF0313 family)